MDWETYNAACAERHLTIARFAPDALVRIDPLAGGWGCSVTPAGDWTFDGTETVEVYGEGVHPLAAMDAVIAQLALLELVG